MSGASAAGAAHVRLPGAAVAVTLCVILASVALSWHFFVQPLRPWPDQGWQLQAAIRHSQGLGLTIQGSVPSGDITRPAFRRLTYFPPLYSLLVSGFLRLGVSLGRTVKAINLTALLIGVAGWMALGRGRFRRFSTLALFGALLSAAGGALVPKGGTSDFVFWAVLPLWIACLLRAARAEEFRGAAAFALLAGALLAGLVAFRWAALFLAPAGMLFLMAAPRTRPVRQRLSAALAAGLPPAVAYLAIVRINRAAASPGSPLDVLPPRWSWNNLATAVPLRFLVTGPLGLDALLARAERVFDLRGEDGRLLLLTCGLPAAVLLVFLLRKLAPAFASRSPFDLLAAIAIAIYVAGLGCFAVRYSWVDLSWSYLEEPRYFRPFLPLAALLWLGALESAPVAVRRVLLGVCAFGALYLLQADARWERTFLTQRDESMELVGFVDRLGRESGLRVVFDNDVSDYIVRPRPNMIAYLYPPPEAAPGLSSSRPSEVLVVRRPRENTAYVKDAAYDAKRVDALRSRFAATLLWRSSGGEYEVYRGVAGMTER